MVKKTLFFMILTSSFLNFSSHHERKIQEAQHYREEVKFFSSTAPNIQPNNILFGPTARSRLILTCHPNIDQKLDTEAMELIQNHLGHLYVIYAGKQQNLGHFPAHRLDLDEVTLSIYERPLKMVFEIPCQATITAPSL